MTCENDRQLIELAAKAAGIKGEWVLDPAFIQERWFFSIPYDNQGMMSAYEWNPLRDDADALRLAVKLSFGIEHNHPLDSGRWVQVSDALGTNLVSEGFEGDPYAATRRVIVRAAAKIGEAK